MRPVRTTTAATAATAAGAALLLALASLAAAPTASAADRTDRAGRAPGCTASACNGRDPVASHCDDDGKLVESRTLGGASGAKVQLFYSAACKANWARSVDAPDGGAVLVTSRNGRKYVRDTDDAKKYVWTPMVDGTVAAQACLGPQNSDALTCTSYH
ncbi:DUF2690 domain-containing protein [Kitasatospora phosalacinea]|uniref:DUF2690 domain-containing protein n=1 Tax=Kitasatospora phosalacinea TaxID=2065 RepID=A0A9W6PL55_9ACTN|nr:DUF2690 domain-containing protein [Kitasatospora phosalacinea]GLW56851.1 hypothetical protein Kpho01_48620 [Kitasatospora phosalacinea]